MRANGISSAALVLAAIAMLVVAWMTRYDLSGIQAGVIWDRWTHETCTVSTSKMLATNNLTCFSQSGG